MSRSADFNPSLVGLNCTLTVVVSPACRLKFDGNDAVNSAASSPESSTEEMMIAGSATPFPYACPKLFTVNVKFVVLCKFCSPKSTEDGRDVRNDTVFAPNSGRTLVT